MTDADVPPADLLLERAISLALEQARRAAALDEVPVGAVILGPDGELLAADHNRTETCNDPTAHAERLALSAACAAAGATRLPAGSLLAVTLEPCAMCAGAIVLARPTWLLFGALDPKAGACGSLRDVVRDPRLNHRVELLPRRREAECGALLTDFFRARRTPSREPADRLALQPPAAGRDAPVSNDAAPPPVGCKGGTGG